MSHINAQTVREGVHGHVRPHLRPNLRRCKSADDIATLRITKECSMPTLFEVRNFSEADAPKVQIRNRSEQHRRRSEIGRIVTSRSLFDPAGPTSIASIFDRTSSISIRLTRFVEFVQQYFLFLQFGILTALIWANVDWEGYSSLWGGQEEGAWANVHFFTNDVFMALFFGVAMVHVTSALLPGGSLFPLKNALSPLLGTLGGVTVPACVYLALVGMENNFASQHQGWAVCIATDISVAWLVAVQVFESGSHPAVQFLLLLAVMDDVIGLIVIAIFFPTGDTKLEWLGLLLGAVATCALLRFYFKINKWWIYNLIGGPLAWWGLHLSGLHPALALCFVVPFVPKEELERMDKNCSLIVHIGLFFFGLCNAGVVLSDIGLITLNVSVSLILGKTMGIFVFTFFGMKVFKLPLPSGMTLHDLALLAHVSGVGLTVSLFVAELAFKDEWMRGEARLGALLSASVGITAICFSKYRRRVTKDSPV